MSNRDTLEETNKLQQGKFREDGIFLGFWLEIPQDRQSNLNSGIALPSPSEPFLDDLNTVQLLLMPQQYTMDEPAAVNIIPTQGGGKFIEDRGQIIKDITIAGTSGHLGNRALAVQGQRPFLDSINRIAAGVGPPLVSDAEAEEISGYSVFLKLRNLFRRYWHIKRFESAEIATQTFFHFMDLKLEDYWQVIPMHFQMQMTSKSPFTWRYTIHLKTIAPSKKLAQKTVLLPEDFEIEAALNVVNASKQGLQDSSPGAYANRLSEVNASARRTVRKLSGFTQTRLSEFIDVGDAFIGFLRLPTFAKNEIIALPKALISRTLNSIAGLEEAVQSLIVAGSRTIAEDIDAFYQESRRIVEGVTARAALIYGETPQEALQREAKKWIDRRNIEDGTVGSLPVQPYIKEEGLKNSRGNKSLSGHLSFRKVSISKGDTVFSIATKELGDPNRFVDLVIFNGLVPPFVIDDNGSGVGRRPGILFTGDDILIPTKTPPLDQAVEIEFVDVAATFNKFDGTLTAVSIPTKTFTDNTQDWLPNQWVGYTVAIGGVKRIIVANTDSMFTVNRSFAVPPVVTDPYRFTYEVFSIRKPLSPVEAIFGRDILVRFNFGSGNSSTENSASAVIGANGDFATITGLDNYVQAIMLMLTTEQGRLIMHKFYGVPPTIGRKSTAQRAALFRLLLERALIMDPRTSKVNRISLGANVDVWSTAIDVTPVNVNHDSIVVQLTK